jgi:putative ABC transport system permease protein
MPPTPIRPLVWLLRIVSSRDAATAAIGDMLEDLSTRRAEGRAPRLSALWVNLQTIRAIMAAFFAAGPRLGRSAGLILRDSTRSLRSAPAHSLFIVFVLAVGVTAATVTFSVVDAVILKPLPVENPEQLISISRVDEGWTEHITPEIYWRLREQVTTVESLGAQLTRTGSPATVSGVTDEWPVTFVTADIFTMLRLKPVIGRLWTSEDEAQGVTDVAVLGNRFWREQFGGSPSILGEQVVVGTRTYRVIGVLSADTDRPELNRSLPIWIPKVVARTGQDTFGIRARMRPGVTPLQVSHDVQRVAGTADWRPSVTRMLDGLVKPVRNWMLIALGASALVVLLACINAANLMLSRAARRGQELAVRAALGASRAQIATVLLAEGVLLSLAATAVALVCAVAGVQVAKTAVTTMLLGVFRAETIALNGRVLVAALAAALLTGALVSLVPAWQTLRAPVSSLLKDADGATASGRRRWRSVFLVAEVATVGVLLVVSWLFVVSLVRVAGTDLGIERTNLIAINPRLGFSGTVDEVEQRVRAVPGVTDVAVSTGASLPLIGRAFGGAWRTTTLERADGLRAAGGEAPFQVLEYRVTSNYFDVAGLRFQRGGTWSAATVFDSPAVVIDTRAARHLFGDDDPVGQVVTATEPAGAFRVVGVVPYVHARGPEDPTAPSAYFALRPSATRDFAGLFVKTSRPAIEMLPMVTDALAPVAPRNKDPFVFVADEAVSRITATRRFTGTVMSVFGLVGVLIGAAGVYAVMASFVVQQTRDIGVRLALGATPSRIQRGVLTTAWRHLVIGLAIGLPLAWWLSRGFTGLLFQVTPADVSVYVGVAVLLAVVGLMAAWLPARRASRIDPIISLRG